MVNKEQLVILKTTLGNIKIKLYNETPMHRDNFLKLVDTNFYKDLLFHRVIEDFMIQGGDPTSKKAKANVSLGSGDLDYTIQSEFNNTLFHKKGALAAARLGDQVNPNKDSSASQFYIVTGSQIKTNELNRIEKQRIERKLQQIYNDLQVINRPTIKELYANGDKENLSELKRNLMLEAEEEFESIKSSLLYTDEQKNIYSEIGGTPFLDGEYTVFGEVVEGLDIVALIKKQETDGSDRPLTDIVMNIQRLN